MDTPTLITVAVGIVIIFVGIYQIRTGKSEVHDFRTAYDAFAEAMRLVEVYAPAADQLVKLGELVVDKDKGIDERVGYVIDMVWSLVDELDPEQIRGILESYIALRNAEKAK